MSYGNYQIYFFPPRIVLYARSASKLIFAHLFPSFSSSQYINDLSRIFFSIIAY